jgi:hypothetical protein
VYTLGIGNFVDARGLSNQVSFSVEVDTEYARLLPVDGTVILGVLSSTL